MENLDMPPFHFPDEDDIPRVRVHTPTPGGWWVSLLALSCMLVAGATVLA